MYSSRALFSLYSFNCFLLRAKAATAFSAS